MKIKVSPGFVLFWTAFYFFDRGNVFEALCISAAVHELGHLAAIKLTGGVVTGLRFQLHGLEIICRNGLMSYPREFICFAAGPLGSLLLALCAAALNMFVLAGTSMTLFMFNILPALPLDGGRMLAAISVWLWGGETGERIAAVFGCVAAAGLDILAIMFQNPMAGCFAVYLGIVNLKRMV